MCCFSIKKELIFPATILRSLNKLKSNDFTLTIVNILTNRRYKNSFLSGILAFCLICIYISEMLNLIYISSNNLLVIRLNNLVFQVVDKKFKIFPILRSYCCQIFMKHFLMLMCIKRNAIYSKVSSKLYCQMIFCNLWVHFCWCAKEIEDLIPIDKLY